ncbi:hypothetical protein KO501_03900 [Alteromonas sp. C1M14]|nr:hypothetical protein [Alteromonas sp. C1M14]
MAFTFFFLLVFLSCGLLFYVEAFKAGMNPRKWALGGLVFGPMLFPLFNMKRYLLWRQIAGYGRPVFGA